MLSYLFSIAVAITCICIYLRKKADNQYSYSNSETSTFMMPSTPQVSDKTKFSVLQKIIEIDNLTNKFGNLRNSSEKFSEDYRDQFHEKTMVTRKCKGHTATRTLVLNKKQVNGSNNCIRI